MRTFGCLLVATTVVVAVHAAAAADSGELIVSDAAGEIVGTVVGTAVEASPNAGSAEENLLWVVRPLDGMSILLLVGDDMLRATNGLVPFWYESRDCTGPAFLDAPSDSEEYAGAVVFDTSIFWPAELGAHRVVRSSATLVRQAEQCGGVLVAPRLCCVPVEGGQMRLTAPFTGFDVADLGLIMPFRIEQEAAAGQ